MLPSDDHAFAFSGSSSVPSGQVSVDCNLTASFNWFVVGSPNRKVKKKKKWKKIFTVMLLE